MMPNNDIQHLIASQQIKRYGNNVTDNKIIHTPPAWLVRSFFFWWHFLLFRFNYR
jgi:hypothetical protein